MKDVIGQIVRHVDDAIFKGNRLGNTRASEVRVTTGEVGLVTDVRIDVGFNNRVYLSTSYPVSRRMFAAQDEFVRNNFIQLLQISLRNEFVLQHHLDWIEFYIGMAIAVSKKSKDSTKHGCIITDVDHKILGLGYNGPPEGFPDSEMPIHRETDIAKAPNKYDMTIHAEVNALNNCLLKPPRGSIAYVDGIACPPCLIHLYQNGIRKVYMLDRTSKMLDERSEKVMSYIAEKSVSSIKGKLELFTVKPNLKWLTELGEEVRNGVY